MKEGINEYISNAEYHGDIEYLSSSALKLILRDIRAYYRRYIEGIDDFKANQDALDFGTYIHALLLEPEKVDEEFTTFDGMRRGKLWDEFKKLNTHKKILGNLEIIKAQHIQDVFNKNDIAKSLISNGKAEETLCTELFGVKIKVRADYITPGKVIDVKTTSGSLKPESIAYTCHKYDYDLSAALYVDAFKKETGVPHDFYFVFVSKDPVDIQVFKASKQMIDNGRRKYKKALKIIAKCRETGIYFDEGVQEIYLNDYMLFPDSEE